MKKVLVLTALAGAMTLAGASSASAAPAAHEKTGYVAPVADTNIVSVQDWVYTVGYIKSYQNLYGITVAEHKTRTQWQSNDAKTQNTSQGQLWQENWTAIGYGFKDESNTWNYFYTNVGEARQSVKFESGIPTPWGHVGGTTFTSTIVTKVYPNGNSSAY
jgi:hypothetical protein